MNEEKDIFDKIMSWEPLSPLRPFWEKHREVLVYLFIGGLTTLVSWAAKFLWNFAFYGGTPDPSVTQNTVLSVVENAAGIAFAYPTNRKWVFRSKNPNILSEAAGFVGSRLVTMLLGWLTNLLLVNVLGVSVYVSTVIAAVLVIVGNYVISKLLVFRNKKDGEDE
ncbi:MAG: GtrA family protein [Oscillospiraceae bacterium]|nr:GtrA family protein [Oscillospiraceae bacterium]